MAAKRMNRTQRRERFRCLPGLLLLAVLGCLLTACGGFRASTASDAAYRILPFDSESGAFDAGIGPERLRTYWQQWKKARRINFRLNPDDAHGRQCGTHVYLQAKGLLQTRFLPEFNFFLVRPSRRPCDYDEACTAAAGDAPVTCAHTQYLWDYPVVIGPKGSPYRDYVMDQAFFNALIQSQAVTIHDEKEAEQLARLYLFLTTTGSRNTLAEILALDVRPEGKHFQVRARLRTPMESENAVQFFDVAADGSIVSANPL